MRVTAQLIDATTSGHLWSERYDRLLADIFTLQEEIQQKIRLKSEADARGTGTV